MRCTEIHMCDGRLENTTAVQRCRMTWLCELWTLQCGTAASAQGRCVVFRHFQGHVGCLGTCALNPKTNRRQKSTASGLKYREIPT
mmetsp:Transcript_62624/g.166188  ORF Transcript_62624/g.166188 Transcript_62624/m.166188 type:complete len:86 (-) Transcript_62624:89-346(-)